MNEQKVRKSFHASKNHTVCPWQGFSSRSDLCEEEPELPILDTAPANQPQGMAEPLSQASGVCVKTYLRTGRKHQRERREQ